MARRSTDSAERVRLEGGLAVLDVHAEADLARAVSAGEGVPVLDEGRAEFLVGESLHALATLLLGGDELLEDLLPLRFLVDRLGRSSDRRGGRAPAAGRGGALGWSGQAWTRPLGSRGRSRQRTAGGSRRLGQLGPRSWARTISSRHGEGAHLRLGRQLTQHLLEVRGAAGVTALGRDLVHALVHVRGDPPVHATELARLQLVDLAGSELLRLAAEHLQRPRVLEEREQETERQSRQGHAARDGNVRLLLVPVVRLLEEVEGRRDEVREPPDDVPRLQGIGLTREPRVLDPQATAPHLADPAAALLLVVLVFAEAGEVADDLIEVAPIEALGGPGGRAVPVHVEGDRRPRPLAQLAREPIVDDARAHDGPRRHRADLVLDRARHHPVQPIP